MSYSSCVLVCFIVVFKSILVYLMSVILQFDWLMSSLTYADLRLRKSFRVGQKIYLSSDERIIIVERIVFISGRKIIIM